MTDYFSSRIGVSDTRKLIYDDAPLAFRQSVLLALEEALTLSGRVLAIVQSGAGLPRPSDQYVDSWASKYLIENCEWPRVFDIAEQGYRALAVSRPTVPEKRSHFADSINLACNANSLGWRMKGGRFEVFGNSVDEEVAATVVTALSNAGLRTSAGELEAARQDLSRRPVPDITGAMQHAGAALECVAREVTQDRTLTFGDILKKHQSLFPGAYYKVAQGVWGIVSNNGRHVQEGTEPAREEALALVNLVAALVGFMVHRGALDLI